MAPAVNFVLSERTLGTHAELLSLEGDTSAAAAARLRERLMGLARAAKPLVVVDLSRVSFVDSAIVQALAEVAGGTAKRSQTRIMVVEPVDPMIARPLEIGRLDVVAEVVGTLGDAARRGNLPVSALQSAIPPPPPPVEPIARPRRTLLGRRRQDQEILRELGQLRRFAQELRREIGMQQHLPAEELERRRTAEEELLRARENEVRASADSGAGAAELADELAGARRQLEEARRQSEQAHGEAARMEDEAEQAHSRVHALENELRALRTQLGTARSEADIARAEADRMESEAEQAHTRIHALEGDLAAARAEAAAPPSATGDVETLRTQLKAARAEAEAMEAETEQAHTRIHALEAEVVELRAQLEQARADAAVADAEQAADDDRARVEAEEARRRDEAERAQRHAEEARLAAEATVEEARKPRPKVPVWADPTPINVNTADLEELMLLPGLGRRPAERIIAAREQSGGFKSVDDLYAIEELPRDRISKIRPYIRV